MPLTSLTKISVPTSDNSNISVLMPKLQYRFRVNLISFGASDATDATRELTRQVMDVTRPNISFEQITIDAYNSRTYLAGKHTWEPITLTLRDDANNNVQRIVGQQLQKQFDFYEQASAVSGDAYKFRMNIEILDGGNGTQAANVIETFDIVGAYIESANYNSLAYNTNDPATVTLSIRYDNAIQYSTEETNRIGVGANIGDRNEASESTSGISQIT